MEVNTDVKLTSFFEGTISSLRSFREIREQYDKQVAFNFNSIGFFYVNENIISDILAFFLNPESDHGQKDVFLNEFLITCGNTNLKGFKEVVVRREASTAENRRIDITIDFPTNKYIIGIENKIHDETQDQNKQLLDYCIELKKRYGKDNFAIFYLTPSGHNPPEHSFDKKAWGVYGKNLVLFSYKNSTEKTISLLDLLDRFELLSQADNVRYFIRDFKKYLEKMYFGGVTMDEKELIAKYVIKESDRIETAWNVSQSMDIIKKHLWQNAKSDIFNFAEQKELNPKIPDYNDLNGKFATLKFTPPRWENTWIVFRFEDRYLQNFWYGLEWDKKECGLLDFFKDFKQATINFEFSDLDLSELNIGKWGEDNALRYWNSSVKIWKMMKEKTENGKYLKITQCIDEKISYILSQIDSLLKEEKWKTIKL